MNAITFNTRNALQQKKYTRSYINSKISQYDLFRRYIGNVKLNQVMCSPLRNDKNPSFNLYNNSKGETMYIDHATGESGDIYKFLKQLWNIDLKEVYKKIVNDLPSEIELKLLKTAYRKDNNIYDIEIRIRRQQFSELDLEYWKSFGISENTLNKYQVNSISYYTINGIISGKYNVNDPLFSYKVNDKFRLYRPKTKYKKDKWRGNLTKDNIFGYEQLPKSGDLLIITKSLKDIMLLHELGYNAIAPSSESTEIPEYYINDLKEKSFKKIVYFFDNDETGIKFAKKLSEKYNSDYIYIDPKYFVKDISDFYKMYGLESTKDYLSFLLEQESDKIS